MMTPIFVIFNPIGPYFIPEQNTIDLPSVEKIGLFLSHLLTEILGSKVGLIFHQNV